MSIILRMQNQVVYSFSHAYILSFIFLVLGTGLNEDIPRLLIECTQSCGYRMYLRRHSVLPLHVIV
jgi:hypothetical protein